MDDILLCYSLRIIILLHFATNFLSLSLSISHTRFKYICIPHRDNLRESFNWRYQYRYTYLIRVQRDTFVNVRLLSFSLFFASSEIEEKIDGWREIGFLHIMLADESRFESTALSGRRTSTWPFIRAMSKNDPLQRSQPSNIQEKGNR